MSFLLYLQSFLKSDSMKKVFFLVASFFIAATIQSQTLIEKIVPAEGTIDIAYEIWELDNRVNLSCWFK